MIWILRDFKLLLDLNLYGEHMPEERITESKIDLDLSAGLTDLYASIYCTEVIKGLMRSHLLQQNLD